MRPVSGWITCELRYHGISSATGDDLERFLCDVMDELYDLDVTDPDLSASLRTGEFTISVITSGNYYDHDALPAVIRAAIHTAGGIP